MLVNQRIIHKDNASLVDLSAKLNSLTADNATIGYVAAEDKLYIGSELPFNHRYIELSTVNDQASVASVEIWDGSQWRAAANVVDETSVNGVTLAQSGILSWTPNRDYTWSEQDTTEDIDELSTLKIYGLYWVRISFSADLKATTGLAYVGHKFATDADLEAQYPDLNRSTVKTAFQAGKTNWNQQHCLAAEEIIRDLMSRSVIVSKNQVLGWEFLNAAAVHRVAEIIMRPFGDEWAEKRATARESYDDAMSVLKFPVDKDNDARLDADERVVYSGRLVRG